MGSCLPRQDQRDQTGEDKQVADALDRETRDEGAGHRGGKGHCERDQKRGGLRAPTKGSGESHPPEQRKHGDTAIEADEDRAVREMRVEHDDAVHDGRDRDDQEADPTGRTRARSLDGAEPRRAADRDVLGRTNPGDHRRWRPERNGDPREKTSSLHALEWCAQSPVIPPSEVRCPAVLAVCQEEPRDLRP